MRMDCNAKFWRFNCKLTEVLNEIVLHVYVNLHLATV